MDIVFFGSSNFAIPSLKELIASRYKVLALITQPDRKRGRSLKVSAPPTKVLALTKDIPVFQPADASGREAISYLKKLEPELFVVVSFGQILSKEVLAIPELYCLNLHGSLLPKYRGAAPTNWAIINGEHTTGVTVIRMNEKLDEGDIMATKEIKIDDEDTNITISEKLSDIGSRTILEVINDIEKGKAVFKKQDENQATYAPKLKKEGGLIDWNEPAEKIRNKVRGLLPWPGAYTHSKDKTLKILKVERCDIEPKSGTVNGEVIDIIKDKGIIVKAGFGVLAITHVQLEGKKILDADAFVRGHRISRGHIFG